MNETQDVSSISVDTTNTSRTTTDQQPKLILHLQSPEAFAKESDFSRLRRSSKGGERSSTDSKEGSGKSKFKDRMAKIELFESHSSVATEANSDDSSFLYNQSGAAGKDTTKGRGAEAAGKGKRTRDMTSLSPDPKNDGAQEPEGVRKRPGQKRSKAKSKS